MTAEKTLPGSPDRQWRQHWPSAAVLVLASLLIFPHLGRDYLWADEGDTAVLARNILQFGVPRAWDGVSLIDSDYGARLNDDLVMVSHPWLQYYVAAASFALVGESAFGARLPFAVLGLLAIALAGTLAWRATANRWTTASAALLVTASVQFLLYARQSRNYTLNAALTLLLVLQFTRLRSWRSALAFAATAILLFHSQPAALAPFAALGALTLLYGPCRPLAPWFWRAMVVAAPFIAPWFWIAASGYRESTGVLESAGQFVPRLLQYFVEVGSVTNAVGALLLGTVLVRRSRATARLPARRRVPVLTEAERSLLVIVAAIVAASGALTAVAQPRDVIFTTGLRYTSGVIPLMAAAVAVLVARVSRGRRTAWVVLLCLLLFTRLGRLPPWTFWQTPVAVRQPGALVTFHNPDSWFDRLFRTGQTAYVESLFVPEPGTTGQIIEFLRTHAAPGDIVVTNGAWESLYFHTRLRMGMTVLPTHPIFSAARARGVPDYVFTAGGARWLVWRQAWGTYRGQAIDRVLRDLAAAKVPFEQAATFPETLWENRENVLYRRFAGDRYIFPWYGEVPPAIIYRVDW